MRLKKNLSSCIACLESICGKGAILYLTLGKRGLRIADEKQ